LRRVSRVRSKNSIGHRQAKGKRNPLNRRQSTVISAVDSRLRSAHVHALSNTMHTSCNPGMKLLR
jgi:hypothetical protein